MQPLKIVRKKHKYIALTRKKEDTRVYFIIQKPWKRLNMLNKICLNDAISA